MMKPRTQSRLASPENPDARACFVRVQLLADYPDLLTVQHLAEITGQSTQTLRALINSGKLPGCRIGRRLYVPKSGFLAYVEQGGGM